MSETMGGPTMGAPAGTPTSAPSAAPNMESREHPMGAMPSMESAPHVEQPEARNSQFSAPVAMAGREASKAVIDTVKRVGIDNAFEELAGNPKKNAQTDPKKTNSIDIVQEGSSDKPVNPEQSMHETEIERLKKLLEEMKKRQKMLEMQLADTEKKLKRTKSESGTKEGEIKTLSTIAHDQQQMIKHQQGVIVDFTRQTDTLAA